MKILFYMKDSRLRASPRHGGPGGFSLSFFRYRTVAGASYRQGWQSSYPFGCRGNNPWICILRFSWIIHSRQVKNRKLFCTNNPSRHNTPSLRFKRAPGCDPCQEYPTYQLPSDPGARPPKGAIHGRDPVTVPARKCFYHLCYHSTI